MRTLDAAQRVVQEHPPVVRANRAGKQRQVAAKTEDRQLRTQHEVTQYQSRCVVLTQGLLSGDVALQRNAFLDDRQRATRSGALLW